MLQTSNSPRPEITAGPAQDDADKTELRKKLLEMIRRNESMRRESQK